MRWLPDIGASDYNDVAVARLRQVHLCVEQGRRVLV